MADAPDLVVLGNLILDDVVHADGSTRFAQAGGAVIYVALAARLCGLSVGIVSRAGRSYPKSMLDALKARGVDVSGIRPMDGPGLRIWLLDEGDRRQVVHRLDGPTHEDASPTFDDIPEPWLSARAVHLAPMPIHVQRGVVERLVTVRGGRSRGSEGPLISLDPYDLLRDGELDRWSFISDLDAFFLSHDEMLLTGSPRAALAGMSGSRTTILLKEGRRGGHALESGVWAGWAPQKTDVVDPTGAGDAFAAGFLAGRLQGLDLGACLGQAASIASLTIQGVGPSALLEAVSKVITAGAQPTSG